MKPTYEQAPVVRKYITHVKGNQQRHYERYNVCVTVKINIQASTVNQMHLDILIYCEVLHYFFWIIPRRLNFMC